MFSTCTDCGCCWSHTPVLPPGAFCRRKSTCRAEPEDHQFFRKSQIGTDLSSFWNPLSRYERESAVFDLNHRCWFVSCPVSATVGLPVKSRKRHHIAASRAVRCPVERHGARSGTAAAELAVTLPLLVILVFGSMEMANAVFLRQSLNVGAYEAAKVVTRPGSNEELARTRCEEVLAVRKVSNYTLTFSPTVTTATPRGTAVTVTLTAPASNLSYGPVRFMAGRSITSTVVMVRL